MVIFQLNEKCVQNLIDGRTSITHSLDRQTEKAVLLAVMHSSASGQRVVKYWFPKSMILIDGKKQFGEIDLEAVKKIEIPEWLYEKRTVTA